LELSIGPRLAAPAEHAPVTLDGAGHATAIVCDDRAAAFCDIAGPKAMCRVTAASPRILAFGASKG
jgi:hypothetical protein